jgi:hypothetical protein
MRKMEAEVTAMKEIAEAEQMQYGQGMDAFRRMLDDGEDPGEALEFLKSVFKRTKQAKGGRVGMALGGAAKGIMEAIKLAARGVKPFGQKQTYKQNVKNMGLSNFDQVEVVTSKQIDELRNANDVDGLFEMLEDVVSGKKFGMANPAQRKVLQENIEEALNDIPLNRDSRERLSEDYFNMMEYYKPDPKETGKVIPFKPREKKFSGGIAGLLKRIMSPRLEKEMVKTGPFQTGHRADILGDMDQIKNVSRNPKTQLPEMDALYDMVQDSPRYNEAMRAAMMKLVDYERFRAILLDDNDKLQALVKAQPELGEDLIRRLFKAGGSQPQFAGGGIVNTLAAPDATKAQQNAMTNQDLFNMNSPYTQEVMRASQEAMANPMRYQLMEQYMNSPAFKEAQERSEQFQLRQAESDQARRMAYMDAEQGLADTYAGMDDFQQVGIGLDKKMDNLGRVLGMGQQQIRQQIAQANPNQPQTGLQSQNVLNIGGLGNLFGLRS